MTISATISRPVAAATSTSTSTVDQISICEFLWEEAVTVRDGTVFFTVPDAMIGKSVTSVTLSPGNSANVGDVTLTVQLMHQRTNQDFVTLSGFNFRFHDTNPLLEIPVSTLTLAANSKLRLNITGVNGNIQGLSATLSVE